VSDGWGTEHGDESIDDLDDVLTVGRLGLGCWRMVGQSTVDAQATVEAAVECGMHFVDTAAVYGYDWGGTGFGSCEERLGDVLRVAPALRDQIVIATKGGIIPPIPYDSSSLITQCEDSLRRLSVDHVDLYQVHRPDPFTHPADVATQLDELVLSGKATSIGVSNYTVEQTAALVSFLEAPLASIQPEINLLHTHALFDGTLDQASMLDAHVLAWSPLAGGRLLQDHGPLTAKLDEIAASRGVSRAAVALSWVLHLPSAPTALVGSQNPDRIREAAAATTVELDRTEWFSLMQSAGVMLP
jgi:predicted oxidoreductase